MKAKVIKTKAEYEAALTRIEKLMDAAPNTPQGDQLDLLSLSVHDYEEKTFPIDKPDPVAAIRFRMEQQGLAPKDLVPFLGSRSRVSELLSGRRGLISWQITPRVLTDAMAAGGAEAKRAFNAMMEMGKIDIAQIEAARRG